MTAVRDGEIVIHHINIRQSISILLSKIITIDVISATVIGLALFSLSTGAEFVGVEIKFNVYSLTIFSSLAILKILLTVYVVLKWLNEYYEITPDYIYHRRGIFYKKEERIKIPSIDVVELEQEILGGILNYGTVKIYNYRRYELMSLFLIHNPKRYQRIIEELAPRSDEGKKTFGDNIFSGGQD